MLKVKIKRETIEIVLAKKNISQNKLALELGISNGYMSQLLNGTRFPSPKLRDKILKSLKGHSFEDLFLMDLKSNG